MPIITTFNYTIDDLNGFANDVKNCLIREAGFKELDEYVVVVGRRGMLSRIACKLTKKEEEQVIIKVVKRIDKEQPLADET